jgi:hypothetical protein
MEKKIKLMIGGLILLVLLLAASTVALTSKNQSLAQEIAKVKQDTQAQIQLFDKETDQCEEQVKRNNTIKDGYFLMITNLKNKFDSLKKVSDVRIHRLGTQVNELEHENEELITQLEKEQELYAELESTVSQLENRLNILNFNYKAAIANAAENAEEKEMLEKQFLAEKTPPSDFTFSDDFVEGTVTYDSIGKPNVSIVYPEKLYKKGKFDLSIQPTVGVGPSMGFDEVNNTTYAGWGVNAGISVVPKQRYDDINQVKREIETRIIQKERVYNKQLEVLSKDKPKSTEIDSF